jgi:hypothetical protein
MLKAVNLLFSLFNTSLKLGIHVQHQLSITSDASNLLSSLFNISVKLSYTLLIPVKSQLPYISKALKDIKSKGLRVSVTQDHPQATRERTKS